MVSRETPKKKKLTKAELRVEANNLMWRAVMDTVEGRFVISSILGWGNIYNLDGEMSLDHALSNRQEGKREMALSVLAEALTARPDAYILMDREAKAFNERYEIKDTNIGEE